MSNSSQHSRYNSLLIEVFASKLYLDRLSEAVFGRRKYGPHLLLGSAIALSYAFRTPLLLAEPWRFTTSLSIVGGLWLGLIGARYMRNGYEDAIDHLRLEQRPTEYDHSQFATIVSLRMQAAIYVLALVGIYVNFFGFGAETLIAE
ncbi:hypothetical protein [Natronomonas gomsonensis]|uniref:hypothetical protein n=1 Tax=Natronomonas gomsonensis TaxID=1046043 RepID=UPI0015B87D22|nr:hypothetical protein [Natronomonas gomsonensis]